MSILNKSFIYGTFVSLTAFLALGLANPIARLFLVEILAAILISFVIVRESVKFSPVKIIFAFLSLITIYFLITWLIVGDNPMYGNIIGFYSNIGLALGVFFFGLFCSKYLNTNNLFKFAFFLFFAANFYRFIFERSIIIDKTYGNMTLNMGYDFVSLLPFLLLFKKKWIPIAISPLIIYTVIMCIKRGAILITALFYIYFIYVYFVKNEKVHKMRNIFIGIALMIGAGYLALDFYMQNDYLQVRMQNMMEGDMNGRDYIFSKIINHWQNEVGIFEFIFGSGFCSSYKIAGNYAHNDWLELLAMSGVIGPIAYLTFFVKEYRYARSVYDAELKQIIYVILLIWFAKTFFSMSYCSIANMPMSLLLGYVVGLSIKEKNIIL